MCGLRKCESCCRQSLNHGKSGTVDQWRKWILGLTEHPIGASLTDEKCSAGFLQCWGKCTTWLRNSSSALLTMMPFIFGKLNTSLFPQVINISPFYRTMLLECLCQCFWILHVYVCVCLCSHKIIKIKDSFSMYPIESFLGSLPYQTGNLKAHSFQPWPKDTVMAMTGLAPCSEAKHPFFGLATVTHWSHGSLTIACFKNAIGMHVGYIFNMQW